MAEARVSVNLDAFTCPICLDLLNDPVSVPCGHSFCKSCINMQWDGKVRDRVYSCPVCNHRFGSRPILGRNIVLAEIVEKLKNAHVPERTLAGPSDVECDVCVGRKHKAVKSCLVCLASYCEVHLNLHNELNPGNTHQVTQTRYNFKDRICEHHLKPEEFYCRTEEKTVCRECLSICGNHKTTTLRNERFKQETLDMMQHEDIKDNVDDVKAICGECFTHMGKTKQEIKNIQTQVLQRAEVAEKSVKCLKKAIYLIKSSAKTTLDQSEKVFAELISSAERKRSEIRDLVKARENAEVQRAENILKRMEQEVAELKKRDDELTQLPQLDDDFLFIRTFRTLFDFSPFDDVAHITVKKNLFKEIQVSVSELAEKVKQFCVSISHLNSTSVSRCHVVQTSVPKVREDVLQYFRQMTVDPSTAHTDLQLSEGNRKITFDDTKPNMDRGPDTFNYYAQALCREPLQERCYWEVEWAGKQVYIAASYRGVERKGCCYHFGFGHNDKSWSLRCNSTGLVFFHNARKTIISGPVPTRVGIYLDHRAGSLSFYSITDTMTLLYRLCTTFTEPLHAAFWVFDDSSLQLCGENEKLLPHTHPTAAKNMYVDQFYLENPYTN